MAGASAAAAAATTPSPFPLPPPVPGNPRVRASSLPSSFPSRPRRTNHLRQKILKTLENKPYPDPSNPQFPHQNPPISTQETPPDDTHQFSISKGPGFVDEVLGTFSTKSFTKLGLYLVGAFIFQTICAVLIFGTNDLHDKDDNLNEKKPKSKSESKTDLLSSEETKGGGIRSVDKFETENRIMEIQEMARRAREQEKVEAMRKGLVEEESDGIDHDSIDMAVKKKEVDDRLVKMRKSLEGNYQKPPVKKIARKEGDVGNNVDDDDLLMFKKKYKYKSPSVDLGDKPKGFDGRKDVNVANGAVINGALQTDKENDVRGGSEISVGKDENEEHEPSATKAESIDGTSKEPKYDKQTSKVEKSGKSNNLETKKPRGFGKESSETTITTKHDDFNKNGSLKSKRGGNRKSARKLEDKSSTQTDFWWTSLPYVMAVKMQSGGNDEESSGLFVLRNTSGLSHTVAFEDRSDVTNFCYLLESFFEDLPNFSTDIVHIPTNELEKEVKTQLMKVIVVKKGQLKLYIGQPLEDVESALHTLIDQQSKPLLHKLLLQAFLLGYNKFDHSNTSMADKFNWQKSRYFSSSSSLSSGANLVISARLCENHTIWSTGSELVCPSKREVMVFGSFKQPGTLLPKAPKGRGWRTALLFDELGELLQNGALRIAAVVQLI
ncbi:hypothetical protein L1987_55943 [Smallanthus sonchifolius]|uniref:Uncharacterized protein n=1 Tax=Smallanthus sonchifolius TaxID=185202 RepID=A0ACB9EB10_9ASTR|nr:hypothetical protein L1987_55943 [Smallanthus sonchifolius]